MNTPKQPAAGRDTASRAFPDLASDRIVLRAWAVGDVDVLVRAGNDHALRAQLDLPDPYTAQDARDYIAQCAVGWATGVQFTFAVTELPAGTVVGSVRVGPSPNGATAGYWTAPGSRRRGFAANALRLVSAWAIESGLSPVRLYIDRDNIASQRVARNAGYRHDEHPAIVDPEGLPGDLVFITPTPWPPG